MSWALKGTGLWWAAHTPLWTPHLPEFMVFSFKSRRCHQPVRPRVIVHMLSETHCDARVGYEAVTSARNSMVDVARSMHPLPGGVPYSGPFHSAATTDLLSSGLMCLASEGFLLSGGAALAGSVLTLGNPRAPSAIWSSTRVGIRAGVSASVSVAAYGLLCTCLCRDPLGSQ